MSVLNTMLRDLERRGQQPPWSLVSHQPAAAPASAPVRAVPVSSQRRLQALLLLLLATVACAAGVWFWPRPARVPASHPLPSLATAQPAAPVPLAAAVAAVPAPAPQAEPVVPGAGEPVVSATPAAHDAAAPASAQPSLSHASTPRAAARAPIAMAKSATASKPAASAAATVAATNDAPGPEAAAIADTPAVAQSAAQLPLERALQQMAHGHMNEATQLLSAALSERPDWSEARSALATAQAQTGDRAQALATLLAGVSYDPRRFAPTAAQLQAEFNDPVGALQTLDRVPAEARNQAYHRLAGAVAQRADRHDLAVAEYEAALKFDPSNAVVWAGLGMSLQALGRDAPALAAYRSAAGGALSPDLRRFVEARIAALQALAQRQPVAQ